MKKGFALSLLLGAAILLSLLAGCAAAPPEGTLISRKMHELPVMDGSLDDLWLLVRSLDIPVEVASYERFDEESHGRRYEVTLRSLHSEEDLYLFAQWTGDEEKSTGIGSWYYHEQRREWRQKFPNGAFSDAESSFEDKFAFLWEIESGSFLDSGGIIFCHEDYKHTTYPEELMDLWHWKAVRTAAVQQMEDNHLVYVNEELGGTNFNGRRNDEGEPSYLDNIQQLRVNRRRKVLPRYWIPEDPAASYILQGDERKREIVGLDRDNNLIDEDGTVIRKEDFTLETGQSLPGVYELKTATDSRGDITVFELYDPTERTWNLEIRRTLVTGHGDDVQFDDLKKVYNFSIAVFNNSLTTHATPEGIQGKAYSMIFR